MKTLCTTCYGDGYHLVPCCGPLPKDPITHCTGCAHIINHQKCDTCKGSGLMENIAEPVINQSSVDDSDDSEGEYLRQTGQSHFPTIATPEPDEMF